MTGARSPEPEAPVLRLRARQVFNMSVATKQQKALGCSGAVLYVERQQHILPHPRAAMIFSTSLPRFKAFLGDSCHKSTDLACCLLFLVPFILPAARRSVAAASRSILDDLRDAGWLLRWLGWSSAPAALLAA